MEPLHQALLALQDLDQEMSRAELALQQFEPQLAEIEDSRRRGQRCHLVLDSHPTEGLGEEARQLPLQAPDLAPQLLTGEQLVGFDVKKAVSFEQIRHWTRCRV